MYDESIVVLNAEEVQSPVGSVSSGENVHSIERRVPMKIESSLRPVPNMKMQLSEHQTHIPLRSRNNSRGDSSFEDDDDDEEDEDDETELGGESVAVADKGYDPQDYAHLANTSDMRELFDFIGKYTPQPTDLNYKLRPFIPDYIPAVGDIDAFIKIGRPDGKPDDLGLTVLDEPCFEQSEPAILNLQLRQNTKCPSASKTTIIKKVEDADKNKKAIDRWIKDIGELHKNKPPPTVHYSRGMPDIDNLMQEWSSDDVEQTLAEVGLPPEDIDCDLSTYIDIMATILDIPRFESRIETLHVIFSLYAAIQSSVKENETYPQNYGGTPLKMD
uniref:Intraflagellar transport protein 46 homolog n=1 Tax=Cacopsylla melanoneura TaxID=428564 RepID=A0A8D8TBA3_9HEMI